MAVLPDEQENHECWYTAPIEYGKVYGRIALTAFRRQYAYRVAVLAGMVTNLFWGFFRAYLLLAVMSDRSAVAGYDSRQLLVYVAFTQSVLPILAVYGWMDLVKAIRTGEVVMDFCKPVGFYNLWLARDTGRAAFQLVARGAPIMILFVLIFRIQLPSDPATWSVFAVSLILALLTGFAWRFLYSAAGFWVVDSQGIVNIATGISTFLMGFLIPVSFFPPWLRTVAHSTPFPAMVNTSVEILTGVCGPERWAGALFCQALWLVATTAAARLAARYGLRKVVVQGG